MANTQKIERDIFDEIDGLDLFDEVELPVEDKVIFSKEMKDLVRKEISKLPIGKIISSILEKEVPKYFKQTDQMKASFQKDLDQMKSETKKDSLKGESEFKDFRDKTSKNFEKLANEFLSFTQQRWHQFGGFSPQFNDLNIGDPSIEGAWRIVKSGSNLSIQRFESGVWTEKQAVTP